MESVDSKLCFKKLNGVGSIKLHGLSPIAPIANINKKDRRFISPYEVIEGMDEVDNLAAMDWQDFENLIREIFEKEFISSGGRLKLPKQAVMVELMLLHLTLTQYEEEKLLFKQRDTPMLLGFQPLGIYMEPQ